MYFKCLILDEDKNTSYNVIEMLNGYVTGMELNDC